MIKQGMAPLHSGFNLVDVLPILLLDPVSLLMYLLPNFLPNDLGQFQWGKHCSLVP
ncbi:hypothetical protein CPB83DRAFT_853724 [Crepidotus variabilis]|uniref:Uncharacterized protein n=1 Tax=Crepidotus variabilis TaxID=179855 RepID=A0A9P6JQI1_9AGAR|nr:hypothetical protein CPB83DRAFT_853724 [Crepidotus variabilis]